MFVVARNTKKKSPQHVRTATNESEEELVIGNIFSRSPLGEFFRL